MRDRVEGSPLAIIPERSTLFVDGDARPGLVRWLADKAQREFEPSTLGISSAVYVWMTRAPSCHTPPPRLLGGGQETAIH